MIQDHTIDQALVELARTMKALKALRAARKKLMKEQLGQMYAAKPGDGSYSEADLQAVFSSPFRSPYLQLSLLNGATKRASMDLTRKLADLRQGR